MKVRYNIANIENKSYDFTTKKFCLKRKRYMLVCQNKKNVTNVHVIYEQVELLM